MKVDESCILNLGFHLWGSQIDLVIFIQREDI